MSMTDGYFNHERNVQLAITYLNEKIIRQFLKHLKLNPNYPNHTYRKGMGLFVCVDRAPANDNANLRVAYCSSGKITYLNSRQFYAQRNEYHALLDNAFNGTDTTNANKAPHEILLAKINSAPKA